MKPDCPAISTRKPPTPRDTLGCAPGLAGTVGTSNNGGRRLETRHHPPRRRDSHSYRLLWGVTSRPDTMAAPYFDKAMPSASTARVSASGSTHRAAPPPFLTSAAHESAAPSFLTVGLEGPFRPFQPFSVPPIRRRSEFRTNGGSFWGYSQNGGPRCVEPWSQ